MSKRHSLIQFQIKDVFCFRLRIVLGLWIYSVAVNHPRNVPSGSRPDDRRNVTRMILLECEPRPQINQSHQQNTKSTVASLSESICRCQTQSHQSPRWWQNYQQRNRQNKKILIFKTYQFWRVQSSARRCVNGRCCCCWFVVSASKSVWSSSQRNFQQLLINIRWITVPKRSRSQNSDLCNWRRRDPTTNKIYFFVVMTTILNIYRWNVDCLMNFDGDIRSATGNLARAGRKPKLFFFCFCSFSR